MSAKHDSHRTPAPQSNEARASGGRDARKGAQNDDSTDQVNTPPNHGVPTHGAGRFLYEIGQSEADPEITELGDLYREWESCRNRGESFEVERWLK